jgi:hypothetical protein
LYTIQATDVGKYLLYCVVPKAITGNSPGVEACSAATQVVTATPIVTINPINASVNAGSLATFTAAASGSPNPTVPWQFSTDGGATFSNVVGATATLATLSFTATLPQNGYLYRAVLTNGSGSATSTAATLIVKVRKVDLTLILILLLD